MSRIAFLLCSFAMAITFGCQAQEGRSPVYSPAAAFDPSYQGVGDSLKIVSWNVEHFVDKYDNPYINNRREDEPKGDDNRLNEFVKAIRNMDADIVVLQEFESAPFAKQIADTHLEDMGYRYFADHESNNWYMNVVIMSRVPLGVMYGYGAIHTPVRWNENGVEKYKTQDYINTRMWSCEIWVNENYRFMLTALHLKAGRDEDDVAMRLGQIAFIKEQQARFLQANESEDLIILGDLNALPNGVELAALKSGEKGNMFTDGLKEGQFTHPANDPQRRLDYILYNTNFEEEVIEGSARVERPLENMRAVSDHLPVSLMLRL